MSDLLGVGRDIMKASDIYEAIEASINNRLSLLCSKRFRYIAIRGVIFLTLFCHREVMFPIHYSTNVIGNSPYPTRLTL